MKANGGEGGEGERNEVMLHILITYKLQTFERVVYQAIGEGGMEGGRKGGRREGGRERGREKVTHNMYTCSYSWLVGLV